MSTLKNINYKNRGMFLEHLINDSNTYYLNKDTAVIYKKPTPIKVLNVSYRSEKTTLIDKAVFSEISTLDYIGIYKGKYIEFDAKECHNTASFPLSNIKNHQITHIRNIIRHKGIAFLIIFINNKFYLLKGEDLLEFIDKKERKSIPLNLIEEKGYIIKEGYMPRLDYIKAIDEAYMCEESYEKN